MKNIVSVCLCCGGSFIAEKHECYSYCKRRAHKDTCPTCERLIVKAFELQMRVKELPRLRTEDDGS